MISKATEVVVAGGGPAGCSVAVILARRGVKALLIHAGSQSSWSGESLPPGANRMIEPIFGTAPLRNPLHQTAFGNRSAWGSEELVANDFIFHPLGKGWHINRPVFDAELRQCAVDAGVVVEEARITKAVRSDGSWSITLSDDRSVECSILVDATGRSAQLARAQGAQRIYSDRQIALIAEIPNQNDDATTVTEAVESGWWYTSPLPPGKRVVAFLTDGDLLSTPHLGCWIDLLHQTLHIKKLAGDSRPDSIRTSPAETSWLNQLSGEGWIAVGDAAIAWDPLSSQGITTAILMGGEAGNVIDEQLHGSGNRALPDWNLQYRELLKVHCAERCDLALLEQRWPTSAFWKRRQAAISSRGQVEWPMPERPRLLRS